MTFTSLLIKELFSSYTNDFEDNYDYIRFGERHPSGLFDTIKSKFKGLLKDFGIYKEDNTFPRLTSSLGSFDPYFFQLGELYELLDDRKSKELLIKLIAYRMLGPRKVRLPLSNSKYWQDLKSVEELLDKDNSIEIAFMNWKLYKSNLTKLGFPINIFFTAKGIFTDFLLKQYQYDSENLIIKAEKGDILIDAGGCWGDTALFFANEVGEAGAVYTFEFIPSNIEIFNKNLELNPDLKNRVKILQHPVWNESNKEVFFIDNGPGSKVSFDLLNRPDGKVYTLSIDDLVESEGLDKVDFIKMDIEGAEPFALKGAEKTLRRWKPKLAIAIYHSLDDFVNIPKYINSLGLNYRFFLGHYTIHSEETILFAIAQ